MAKNEYEALEQEYRRLARKADARLRALESYQHDKYYKPAIKWAYAKAQKDISKWTDGQGHRFNTKPPQNLASLKAKIADIETFLESPTSTKGGIKKVYQQRADTLNQRYGTNYNWSQMAKFFESETYDKASKMYGSKVIQKAVATIQERKDDIFSKIDNADDKDVRIAVDSIVNQAINDLISEYGLTKDML